jgi:undecaprenyl-diphosphatase
VNTPVGAGAGTDGVDEEPPPEPSASPRDERIDPSAPLADAASDSAALRRARRSAAWLAAALLSIAAALTVSLIVDPVGPWFQAFDDWWLALVSDHRSAPLTDVAEALDLIGSVAVTVPVRILALAVLLLRRRWTQTVAFVVAIVASELCIGPLKALVDRPRPSVRLVETTSASFPSGHAIAAAVTAFGLVIAFLPRGRRRLHWAIAATLFAGSMALSRTYLGAHWATDTIAGACIGAGLAIGVDVTLERWRTTAAEPDHAEVPERRGRSRTHR